MASLAFPINPTNGQIYVGSNKVRYQYSTTTKTWSTQLSTESSIDGANPGATAPLNPTNGTFWLDTDSKSLYVYHITGSTGQWLAVATGTGGSSSDSTGLSLEGSAIYDGNIVLPDVGINIEVQPAT